MQRQLPGRNSMRRRARHWVVLVASSPSPSRPPGPMRTSRRRCRLSAPGTLHFPGSLEIDAPRFDNQLCRNNDFGFAEAGGLSSGRQATGSAVRRSYQRSRQGQMPTGPGRCAKSSRFVTDRRPPPTKRGRSRPRAVRRNVLPKGDTDALSNGGNVFQKRRTRPVPLGGSDSKINRRQP